MDKKNMKKHFYCIVTKKTDINKKISKNEKKQDFFQHTNFLENFFRHLYFSNSIIFVIFGLWVKKFF